MSSREAGAFTNYGCRAPSKASPARDDVNLYWTEGEEGDIIMGGEVVKISVLIRVLC